MDDYEFALKLQNGYDLEAASRAIKNNSSKPFENINPNDDGESLDYAIALSLQEEGTCKPTQPSFLVNSDPKHIVDSSWEVVDPNPNIHDLFVKFDSMFFNNALTNGGVAVNWSSRRMTLCAGMCCYEGRRGLCSIKLSEPLLKLRPRKDLVETLLHEMIHALLFVTANNKDREGHGPEFQKHMNRINAATGANITIYHSFHNEVELYHQHLWKCDGPCQRRPPFYGIVRRAMNRAPSSHDPWWSKHMTSCGGTFVKMKEPEGYSDHSKQNKRKGNKLHVGTSGKRSKNIVNKASGSTSVVGSEDNESVSKTKKTIVNGVIVLCDDDTTDGGSTSTHFSSSTSSVSSLSPSAIQTLPVEYKDIRSNMLAAVEKRLKNKKSSVKHRNSSIHPNDSKRKNTSDQEDLVIIDASSSVTCNSQVPNKIISPSASTSKANCPVCGRDDIPKQVISIHIEYCLEEMEL